MKKLYASLFLASSLVLTSLPAYAAGAAGPAMKIDGVTVLSDAKPETKNNRTMVPLRVVSENLGATVNWANSEVTLKSGGMKVTLKPNSGTATKDGQAVALDAKPYVKNDRIYVPLRFIAETFGSKVDYRDGTVTVDTAPLKIDGTSVKALLHEIHMTMGGIVDRINGNANIAAIYRLLEENKGNKVEAPANYSWSFHLVDSGGYYKIGHFDFIDAKEQSLRQYDLYTLFNENSTVLIHDVTADQWFEFSASARDAINQALGLAEQNGFVKEISNTVA
ncbi:copper amine oxidase N-terminal domain-containing protein [Cohnella thailandensis]|uniref:Copper amine oxidase N-terminal domain-containing protein n=1 Tax=Cohnella thailandensis TaxID=557557 RepID=A0A841T6G1_9BACL|nr:copper amine oxidase N-terminal domain-containing protein [Cohnella thailandensis]MBB6637650.1 copper amine oxidase N-terminal domain-containing protein [Cohnella thailandensis]MBP1974174.1 hypothetical protein [Cohnella thailandensis]